MSQLQRIGQPPRPLFVLTVGCLLICTVGNAAVDLTQVRRLHRQRLYRAAESKCLELLNSSLPEPDYAVALVEFYRIVEDHLATVDASKRSELIDKCHRQLAMAKKHLPAGPYAYLVELQYVSVRARQARLARYDVEANFSDDEYRSAVQFGREVIRDLEDLERRISESMRTANRRRTTSGAVYRQYQRLLNRTRWQLAQAWSELAKCYPDDRTSTLSLLAKALEYARPLSRLRSEPAIAEKSRILLAECLWRTGDRETAKKILDEVIETTRNPCIRLSAATENSKMYLASGQLAEVEKALTVARQTACEDRQKRAEFVFAELDWLVAKAVAARSDRKVWELRAEQLVQQISREFPGYWARRSAVVAARLKPQSQAIPQIQRLDAQAAKSLADEDFEDAVRYNLQAADIVEQQKDDKGAFHRRLRAGNILHQQRQFQRAFEVLRKAAVAASDQPEANQAHLVAIVDCAQLVKSGNQALLQDYFELLNEHLHVWPDRHATSDQVAWWLGTLKKQMGKTDEAIEAISKISAEYPKMSRVIDALRGWSEEQIMRLDDAQRQRMIIESADRIRELTKTIAVGELQRQAELAIIDLQLLDPGNAVAQEAKLRAIMRSVPASEVELKKQARKLLILAYSIQKRFQAAHREVASLADEAMARQLIRRLADTRKGQSFDRQLAKLIVELYELQPDAKLVPDDLQLIYGRALLAAGEYASAVDVLSRQSEKSPTDMALQMELAQALEAAGRFDDALKTWRAIAGELKPGSQRWFRAKYGVASNLMQLGQNEKAVEMIRVTSALHPNLGGGEMKTRFERLLQLADE